MAQDDFDIPSLAKYLHIKPEQVKKMANRDQLPGRRIGGDWKFSRAEIHHWLEDRIGVSDDQELAEVEKVLETPTESANEAELTIGSLLNPSNMEIPLQARTKNSVITQMCQVAANCGLLWEPDKMVTAIRSREQLHPTALENGVALLHPRRPQTNIMGEPFVGLGVTSSGIPFGGPRGVLTDIFFLIASTEESLHLKVLARISRIIQQDNFLESLRMANGASEAIQLIQSADKELS